LAPEEPLEEAEGVVAARGVAAGRGEAALRGVFARELEVLPRDWRYSIAMARRLSLGPLLPPVLGAGALLACMAITKVLRTALAGAGFSLASNYNRTKLHPSTRRLNWMEQNVTVFSVACVLVPP